MNLDLFAPPPPEADNPGLVQALLEETFKEASGALGSFVLSDSGDEERMVSAPVFNADEFTGCVQDDLLGSSAVADPSGWLVDVGEIERNLPVPVLPDASEFSQAKLAAKKGMEWLSAVEAVLLAPYAEDPETQREQLRTFTAELLAQAKLFPAEYFPRHKGSYEPTPVLAMDTETTGLDTRVRYGQDGKLIPGTLLVGVTVAPTPNLGYYLPVRHTGDDGVLNWDSGVIAEWIGDLLMRVIAVFHNATYDLEVLALNGVTSFRQFPYLLDTQILSYNYDINQTVHGLKPVSARLLGRQMIEIAQLFVGFGGIKKNAFIAFETLSASQALVYGASDSMNTMGLALYFLSRQGEENVFLSQPLPVQLDHTLIDTIRNMLRTGLPVNYEYLFFALKDALYRWTLLQQAIDAAAGRPVNIGSQPQLNELLFGQLKIPPLPGMKMGKPKKDGTTLYSLDEEAIGKLHAAYPDLEVLTLIVLYRKLSANIAKLYSKMLTNCWVDAHLPWTRVKLAFSQTRTATGRLASAGNDGKKRVSVRQGKKGLLYTFRRGSWEAGINAQGVPAGPFRTAPARRIGKLPPGAGLDLENPYPPDVEQAFIETCSKL